MIETYMFFLSGCLRLKLDYPTKKLGPKFFLPRPEYDYKTPQKKNHIKMAVGWD